MSKKSVGVVALGLVCALSMFLLSCGSSSSRPAGLLYVLTQNSAGGGNLVSSFAIDLDTGNLALINQNASTCPGESSTADFSPCGPPLSIILDPTGATAFVLDQGLPSATPQVAPTIYAYTVGSDGSLSGPSSNATSLTTNDIPISMVRDAAGQFLFVLDTGTGAPSNCPQRATSAASLPNASGCPAIWVYAATPGSTTLTPAPGSPFLISKTPTALSAITLTPPGGSPGPCSSTAATQELLYVTSNHDLSAQNIDNALSVYCVDSSGDLTEQSGSPYKTNSDPTSVIAVNTSPAGSPSNGGVFVYVGSQGAQAAAVNVYQLCVVESAVCTQQDVNNALMTSVASNTAAGLLPSAMLVDPTSNFLYVASQITGQVFGFRISTSAGTLSALSPANVATGSQPVALAMRASTSANPGQFLFVSNSTSSNITGITVNIDTGTMSNPITVISPPEPGSMAAN
jgi:Lactonase, 7-bladed beta-propeller